MIKRVSTLILLFTLFSIFLLSSCKKIEDATPEYLDNVVGEWYLEYKGVWDTPNIIATFESNCTGTFTREDGSKTWTFTWSYDEAAKSYLIYRASDEYVRFARISNNNGVSVMHFHDFVGTKVK